MKKIIIIITLSFLLFSGVVSAQEDALPPAGITPESPFFFLDRFSENIVTFFTFGNAAKAARFLALGEERLAEAKVLAEKGDDKTGEAVKLFEEQLNNAKKKAQESGSLDVNVKITQATTKHLSVFDKMIERVPGQAKDPLRAAKERSLSGQLTVLRKIVNLDPQKAIDIFANAAEGRLREAQVKAEKGSTNEEEAAETAKALEEYDQYVQFGQEISAKAAEIRNGNTTIRDLVKKATSRHIQVLEGVRQKLPLQAQDKFQNVFDHVPSPRPQSLPKTQPPVPPKKQVPQGRSNTPTPIPTPTSTEQNATKPNLAEQFFLLEGELTGARERGSNLSPEHYDRIKSDLAKLGSQGYPQNEIERLSQIARDLSPHLQGQVKQEPTLTPSSVAQQTNTPSTPKPNCNNNLSPVFTNHITDMSKVSYVVPPPTMGSGPSLKTHSYIGTNGVKVPIFAPTAMTLRAGAHSVGGPYGFEFQVSCEVTVRYGHITDPVDALKKLLPIEPAPDSRTQELSPVSFAAGDLIAYTTGTKAAGNWDFGVYNSTKVNRYAGDPSWNNSSVYTTAVCPFDYFSPDLKAEYTAKFDSKILGGNPPHGESFCL